MAKILILDDDPFVQKLIRLTLEAGEHKVVCLSEPLELMPFAEKNRVDLMVLDVLMPHITGWDLLKEIRKNPKTRLIPVMMLSTLSDAPHKVRGLQSGADDYLSKPFDPAELLTRVEVLIKHQLSPEVFLRGSLSANPIPNLLEYFSLHPQTGLLVINSEEEIGELILNMNKIAHAAIGDLRGNEAIEVICELTKGTFSFNPYDAFQPEPSENSIDINRVLIDLAWMKDILETKAAFLPDPLAPLKMNAKSPRLVRTLAFLPVEKVRARLQQLPKPTLSDLIDLRISSPIRLKLTVAVLAEQGIIAT